MSIGPNSPLYGMSQAQLQTALSNAQTAYLQFMSGARSVSISYSQGDGSKSVTYDRIEGGIAQLRFFIQELNRALGNTACPPRRHVRFSWPR